MEEMISRWIRETIQEYEKAKRNHNLYRMNEMRILKDALYELRSKLLKSQD